MTASLHIITGPTAAGKTAYALDYAERLGAEIVSCDASLVYRGMDIGTAKPSPEERARVPHHLIDVREVDEPFDVVAYAAAAGDAVARIRRKGRPVVVVGGSGFYLRSFLAPVVDTVAVPADVRERVAAWYAREGLPGLLARLRELSPGGLGRLDTRNPRRVLRAAERCLASGRELPELQAEFAARPTPYADMAKRVVLLERDSGELRERIAGRTERMLAAGLVAEVARLRERGIERNPSAASAIGYRETLEHLRGAFGRDALAAAITRNTLRLVKKQRKWFRTQLGEPDAIVRPGEG